MSHERKLSYYYCCYDTEDLAAELIDVDETNSALRDLIVAGAPKDLIVSTAKAINQDLADWFSSEIPW